MFTTAAIAVLSLILWYLFYVAGGQKPNTEETMLLVAVSAIVIFAARVIWKRLRTRGKKNE